MVACPQPTGTCWPSLPHVPGVIEKSVATASTRCKDLGAVADQVAVAQRRGDPPFSIKKAEVMPKTKSPVAVLTWPPPSWAT